MRAATVLVCTVTVEDGRLGCVWDGGRRVAVHVELAGGLRRVADWDIWNHEWDTPLVDMTPESFERFVRIRLAQPGLVEELIELAAA
jgi:hypothetical protein